MKKIVCSHVLVLLFVLMFQGVGYASLLGYEFSGTFDSTSLSLAGDSFSGFFQYDTSGDPASQYDLSYVSVGATTYSDPASLINAPGGDYLEVSGDTGSDPTDVYWYLYSLFNLSSVDLSQALPLSSWLGSSFIFGTSDGTIYAYGAVDSLVAQTSAPVPEPATMLLLGSGLLGLVGFRKKLVRK